jgi:hypothetical protein
MLDEGQYASITEMAAAERIERGYLGSLLRLTLLAPDLLEVILDGRQALGLSLSCLLAEIAEVWEQQRDNLMGCVAFRASPLAPGLDDNKLASRRY